MEPIATRCSYWASFVGTDRYHDLAMEVSEYLVGSPAFKAGDTGDPRMAGSIPVHLRQSRRRRDWRRRYFPGFALQLSQSVAALLDARLLRRRRSLVVRPSLPHAASQSSMRIQALALTGVGPAVARGVSALVVLAVLFGVSAPVGAQARLLSVSPVDGASVSVLRDVVFEFDSLLIADGAEVTVTKLDGTAFPIEVSVDGRTLTGTVVGALPSGNYEVGYSVRSADGATNTGTIRIGVDAPDQALSGGLLAVIGIAAGLFIYLGLVFRADVKRRPPR